MQVSNLQAIERGFWLSHDALYNLHEPACDLNGFLAKINTYPDITVICNLTIIVSEFDRVVQMSTQSPKLLSYDTTFQLGDYLLSLLFHHVVLFPSLVLSALFLFHGRKFQMESSIMKHVSSVVPVIRSNKQENTIVTDDQAGICKVILITDQCLPTLTQLRCLNHTINATKIGL